MGQCVALTNEKDIKGNWIKCGLDTPPGYRYCDEHKTRKRAIDERQEKALTNVVEASEIFTGEIVEQPTGNEISKVPVEQRNIYDKTNDVLNKALEWESKTWDMVMSLSPDEMHYQDKAGAEQLHSFVAMNERAQDRTLRAVTAIAKLNIDAQSVNVNKMVKELIKGVVTKVFTRMGLEPQQIDLARQYLAEEFERAEQQAG